MLAARWAAKVWSDSDLVCVLSAIAAVKGHPAIAEAAHSGAKRCKPSQMVAGGRYELYSNYPLQIQAVAASVAAKQGGREREK
jgi:hypothetical protein